MPRYALPPPARDRRQVIGRRLSALEHLTCETILALMIDVTAEVRDSTVFSLFPRTLSEGSATTSSPCMITST